MLRVMNFCIRVFYRGIRAILMEPLRVFLSSLSPSRLYSKYNTISRNQKLFFGFILIVLLLIYFVTSYGFPSFYHGQMQTSSLDVCLNDRISHLSQNIFQNDAVYFHSPLEENEVHYFPFTGNGYFGCSWQGQGKLYIKHQRTLSAGINIFPLVDLKVEGFRSKDIYSIDFVAGSILKVRCFKLHSLCISTSVTAYAHRTRPGILVQDVQIYNPTNRPARIQFSKLDHKSWKGATSKTIHVRGETYRLIMGTVRTGKLQMYIVAFAEPHIPSTLTVKLGDTVRRFFVSAVRYSGPHNSLKVNDAKRNSLEEELQEELAEALKVGQSTLVNEHRGAWTQLWQSGLSISRSLAPGALNGVRVNMTIFYLLSQVSLLNSTSMGWHPGGCYSGHHTMQATTLWSSPRDESALSQLASKWLITLQKQGCGPLVQMGAVGVSQAMLLSVGQLIHTRDHLEFGMHPSDLHRDYVFRNIRYSGGLLNITVEVGDDNRAQMFVAARPRPGYKLYACDAGCLDAPVQLTEQRTQMPVKVTHPRTAVLYVTENREHISELKHAIHVREIVEAPAHEHHVIALHKHGHPYGGLPLMFWVALVVLVLLFHLFLVKLVYNEYCRGETLIPPPRHTGSYYSKVRYRPA